MPSTTLIRRSLAVAAAASVCLSGVGAAAAAADASEGSKTLRALKGGYRNVGVNDAINYAKPLAGAQMQYSANSDMSSPSLFTLPVPALPGDPVVTDAAGETSVPGLSTKTWYVNEKTAPNGWLTLPQLAWGGEVPTTQDYVGKAEVKDSGGPFTASIRDSSNDKSSTRFVNALQNPPAPAECEKGLNILMLLDTSGSTKGFETQYKDAATAFVNALAKPPAVGASTMKITSFASAVNSGNATSYDLATVSGKNDANDKIADIYSNPGEGATNWDAALQDASNANVDLVVFITDGNPTVRVNHLDDGDKTNIDDVTYAIASANTAKNPDEKEGGLSQRIIGVGVGDNLSERNIAAVTGPEKGTDYLLSPTPADLEALLKTLASNLCGPTLELTKTVAPAKGTGAFNLLIDGNQLATNVGDGGTTEPQTLEAGVHTLEETAGTEPLPDGTSLADYVTSLACLDENGNEVPAKQDEKNPYQYSVDLKDGEHVKCTFTNIKKATVTVDKATLPSSDTETKFGFTSTLPGSDFSLTGNGATTGKISVTPNPTDPYKVTENPTTGWQFTKLDCGDTKSVEIDGSTAAINPQPGENITCTYTNTQDGTIKVVKSVLPETDPGVFNLTIGEKTYAENVPNGETNSTGVQSFAPGEYAIGETAGTDPQTDLGNYKASYDCGKASFDSETRTVTLNPGEDVVCTITNTRNTGTITLNKSLDPTTDAGKFNLIIGETVYAENVGHNGTTDAQTLTSGLTYSLAETAGTGTTLDNYTSKLACTEGGEPIPVVESSVSLGNGQNIICTITNTRKTGTITLNKTLAPANDPGLFNLQIGGTTLATNVGGGGTTAAQTLPSGTTYTLGETAGTGTTLSDYTATLDCSDAQGAVTVTDSSVALAAGQNITCNLTNTRKTGTVTITKNVTDGSAGTFAFSGTIGPNFTLDSGQSGQFTLVPGTYTVTEEPSAAFTLQALTCSDSGDASGGSTVDVPTGTATINLQSGEAITCTYLNAPGGGVLPSVTGTARISGANGCPSGRYTFARVRGTNIASVKYYIYGKLVKTLTKRNKTVFYQLNYPVSRLRYGRSLVTARVTFVENSTPATKTLKIRLSRCRPATPRFTG